VRRLSGLDAAFLAFDSPTVHAHIGAIHVLDPGRSRAAGGVAAVRSLIAARLRVVEPLRWQLVSVPFGLHHPLWRRIDPATVDLDVHVRGCDAGDGESLESVAARFYATPLDRARPLWEMLVVDGLPGRRRAVLTKVHHAVMDGVSGAQISTLLFGTERERVPGSSPGRGESESVVDPEPSAAEMLAYAMKSLATSVGALPIPSMASLGRARSVAPISAPRSRLSSVLGGSRSVGLASVALDVVKSAARVHGVTVNDIVLAAVGDALRAYQLRVGESTAESLVALVPVSMRGAQGGESGNQVSGIAVRLCTDVESPMERLPGSIAGFGTVAGAAAVVPPFLVAGGARLYSALLKQDRTRPVFNVTVSNIAGPPVPLFVAGARLIGWYPIGPVTDGAGLNITVLSHNGTLFAGLLACADAAPDLGIAARRVESAIGALSG
jgi:diacylglycerol O-acyltransferase / wax synthase